jgi:hypothetical protein
MCKIERIQVPPEDREQLGRLVRDRNTPQKIVWRSQIVLLAGDGIGAVEVATRVGRSVLTVRRWRRRYAKKGVEAPAFITCWNHVLGCSPPDRYQPTGRFRSLT